MIPRVASVSGSSTMSMSVIASIRSRPSVPWKQATPLSDFSLALQPATLKPSAPSLDRGVFAKHAQAQHADMDLGGLRLIVVVGPDSLALLALVAPQLAQVRERVHDHPLAHPAGEIGSTTRTIVQPGSAGSAKR